MSKNIWLIKNRFPIGCIVTFAYPSCGSQFEVIDVCQDKGYLVGFCIVVKPLKNPSHVYTFSIEILKRII